MYEYNKFKMSRTIWDKELALYYGWFSVSVIHNFFEYFIKKQEAITDKSSVQIYVKKIQRRITFKIKTGYYIELWTPDIVKLLGSTGRRITKDKNGEKVYQLEITNNWHQFIVILSIIISMIYESFVYLFQLNYSVSYWIFHQ